MTATLNLIILAVKDVERSAEFYREAFGWPEVVRVESYVELQVSTLLRLGLYKHQHFADSSGKYPVQITSGNSSGTELYVHVENIQESIGKLERVGALRISELRPRTWGDEVAYFVDPDKNVIALARRCN